MKLDLKDRNKRVLVGVLCNWLVLGTLVYAAGLQFSSPDLYYLTVQEDEYLEWATFWAFILAAALATFDGMHWRQHSGHRP